MCRVMDFFDLLLSVYLVTMKPTFGRVENMCDTSQGKIYRRGGTSVCGIRKLSDGHHLRAVFRHVHLLVFVVHQRVRSLALDHRAVRCPQIELSI